MALGRRCHEGNCHPATLSQSIHGFFSILGPLRGSTVRDVIWALFVRRYCYYCC